MEEIPKTYSITGKYSSHVVQPRKCGVKRHARRIKTYTGFIQCRRKLYSLLYVCVRKSMSKERKPASGESDDWRSWNWREDANEDSPIETATICPVCVSCDLLAMHRWKSGTPKTAKSGKPPMLLSCPCCDFECEADELPDYQ